MGMGQSTNAKTSEVTRVNHAHVLPVTQNLGRKGLTDAGSRFVSSAPEQRRAELWVPSAAHTRVSLAKLCPRIKRIGGAAPQPEDQGDK